ncbi:hypothetical protein [Paenibacillus rigui]|uniref:Histidine kinase N-terminal 7TM region domain-containing protein n=1 Tax=Paenibacillus rigui TaxID=554312 RepID=A0A229UIT2_9BACL|nr:hypothetical protein [Paenibacillus rigui]OXM83290.1 hypothetical protein CF651_26550 [Paenibacillus rigui]
MMLVTAGYAVIAVMEWLYLKRRNRKRRTFAVVFIFMGLTWLYNMSLLLFKHLPNPNRLIEYLFQIS